MEYAQGKKNERLKLLMKALKIKNIHLAKAIDTAPAFISQLRSGRQNITTDFAFRISKRYPLVNIDWLLHGDGEMFLEAVPGKNRIVVSEPDAKYEAKPGDPLGALRALLERHEERLAELEAEVARLDKEVRWVRGEDDL